MASVLTPATLVIAASGTSGADGVCDTLGLCDTIPTARQPAPTVPDNTIVDEPERGAGQPPESNPTDQPSTTAVLASTTTTPPGGSSACTVSATLVPSCGAWFGASTPSGDGSFDYATGLTEYEQAAGNTPDILHFYKTNGDTFPTAGEAALAQRPGKQRSMLFYNWKPSTTHTWRAVADGAVDTRIATLAASLRAYPHAIFLTIFHEGEDNVRTAAGSGYTPADYVSMYRHVVDELRAAGVTNVVYVWNVMGHSGWADLLDQMYPGDGYVDWIAYDPYAKNGAAANIGDVLNKAKPLIGWPGFYTWATTKAPGMPIMLGEWGVDLRTNADPAVALSGGPAMLARDFPMLKALVYWNDVDEVDTRLSRPAAASTGYIDAFRAFANDPYFNRIDPSTAP